MQCPNCKSESIDRMRTDDMPTAIRRSHQCRMCHAEFKTFQVYEFQYRMMAAMVDCMNYYLELHSREEADKAEREIAGIR